MLTLQQLERAKMVKGGYSSLQLMDGGFGNDTVIPNDNNYGRGSGIGLSSDVHAYSDKSTG